MGSSVWSALNSFRSLKSIKSQNFLLIFPYIWFLLFYQHTWYYLDIALQNCSWKEPEEKIFQFYPLSKQGLNISFFNPLIYFLCIPNIFLISLLFSIHTSRSYIPNTVIPCLDFWKSFLVIPTILPLFSSNLFLTCQSE